MAELRDKSTRGIFGGLFITGSDLRYRLMDLLDLFADLQAAQTRSGASCQKANGCDGRCCRVDLMKGEPSVTASESARIDQTLRKLASFEFYEAGKRACKFLSKQGRCKIYDSRPIDCRVHWCADEQMSSGKEPEVEALLDAYYAEHEREYLDSVLISSKVFFGEDPRG